MAPPFMNAHGLVTKIFDKIIEASQKATWIPEFGKARELDAAGFEDWVRAEMHADASYLEAMPPDTLYAGLERYWAKRLSSDHV